MRRRDEQGTRMRWMWLAGAGFTSAAIGAQSGAGEVNGWLSFGFSLAWRDRR